MGIQREGGGYPEGGWWVSRGRVVGIQREGGGYPGGGYSLPRVVMSRGGYSSLGYIGHGLLRDTDPRRPTGKLSCIHVCLLTDPPYPFKMDNWSVRK